MIYVSLQSIVAGKDEQIKCRSAIIDITERKRMEGVLREYERVIENSRDMIAAVDRNHNYVLANATFLKYQGLDRSQVIGRSVRDIVGADVFETVVKKNLEACFRGETVQYKIKRLYPELGERDLLVRYFPVENPTGINRIVSIIHDITERKRAETALQESEARYRAFFENSIDAVLITSPDGSIEEANAEACRIFGMTREELAGAGRNGVTDPSDPRLAVAIEERARTGRFKGELNLRRSDGTVFPCEVSSSVFTDKKGLVKTSMIIRDITERKRMLKERENLILELQKAFGEVRTLRGILPICASCKKIRDDKGYWNQLESYIRDHSEAEFSHSLCPECIEKLYPGYRDKLKKG